MKKNQSLGRGLDALLIENEIADEYDANEIKIININIIEPNKNQPRKFFDKEKLEELATSISQHGLLQPIIVRPYEDRYQIISGERRWRAARMAGLIEIPIIIREIDEKTSLELGLIENLQREDLNIVEEAEGYKVLIEEHKLTQEEISKRVGKARSSISNAMRILVLPKEVLQFVLDGKLTSGHSRALLPLCDIFASEEIIKTAKSVIEKNLTVRQVEAMVKITITKKKKKAVKSDDIYIKEIEQTISEHWGRKVKIISSGKKGKIELEFYGKDDLNSLIETLLKEL